MKIRNPFRFAFFIVATAALALASGPALAHAKLLSEVPPAADAAAPQAAPAPFTEIRLSFSEGLILTFSKLTVTALDGKDVPLGALALDPEDKAELVAPLTGPLPVGEYMVDWTAVSDDGHKSAGTYTFKVAQ
jgi:methionine-rich copper-binding protein CopC